MLVASQQLQRLKSLFRQTIWLSLAFVASFFWYVRSEQVIDKANEQRLQSFFLADELRQSSDDLTRMVRSYVTTGAPEYKEYFQDIIAIRDGKAPRPLDYHHVYWDLVFAGRAKPRALGPAVPLLSLMQQAGFTETEFAILAKAKAFSDELTKIEFQAMQQKEAAAALPQMQQLLASQAALQLLFDQKYHNAKAGIMRPIDEFYALVDKRTATQVEQALSWADAYRWLFIVIACWLFALIWRIRRQFNAVLGTSLAELYKHISAMGSSASTDLIEVGSAQQDTVLGWLARTQQRLMLLDETRLMTQHRLEHLAHYDGLTGLANRLLLLQSLQRAMDQQPQQLLGLAYLDLDGFKTINDHHGHLLGDRVLVKLAQRLSHLLRPDDLIARFGGDEFVVLLYPLTDEQQGCELLNTVLEQISKPLLLDDLNLQLSASAGLTFYPQPQVQADQLLRQADQAMYLAKQGGKNRYHCFDSAQEAHLRGYHHQIELIKNALELGQFELFYQPKVNMATGQVIGLEALIRWQHPERGLVSPAEFLPLLEQHSLGIRLGQWVLSDAIRQLALWLRRGIRLPVSINIAANHLQHPDFTKDLALLIKKQPQVAAFVELEILESSALQDVAKVNALMTECSALGVSFALDDFGTGYSSLSYVKRLPLHTLKVDQSFVRDLLADDDDVPILQGMLALARAFDMQIIAEGVESEAHGLKLLQMGYQLAQGYAIARPMPAALLLDWLPTWQPPASWLQNHSHIR